MIDEEQLDARSAHATAPVSPGQDEHVRSGGQALVNTGHGTVHGAHAGHGSMSFDHADMQQHAGHDPKVFKDRFWLSLTLAVPVVVTAGTVMDWFGYRLDFPGVSWLAPVFGTVTFFYGGWPFLRGAVSEVKQRQPGMMLLIAMAITVAFVASWLARIGVSDVEVWWELSLLLVIMLLGHWLEMRTVVGAHNALAALAELVPDKADRVTADGDTETVPAGELMVGDVVLVRPGGRVPADGRVIGGRAEFDESAITGESNPVERGEGKLVVASSVAVDGSVRVRVCAVGDDTALGGIQRLVASAETSNSRAQRLADRAAALLFYVAVAAAAVTVIVWLLLGEPREALSRSLTVLVIACPHALGLAIPLVVSISSSKAARNGILVKDRLALERMRTVDAVLFDKTGTLTEGRHAVTAVASTDENDDRVLTLAAAVERDSEHPLAHAIVQAAEEHGLPVPRARDFVPMPGRGVEAQVDGIVVAVGGPALLQQRALELPEDLRTTVSAWVSQGAAVLHVVADGVVIGAIELEDQVRPESRQAVARSRARGVTVAMITGDASHVAERVAAELGIDEVYAEVLPEDKDQTVRRLQERGQTVAMVGDGINDAPALARADVGIAIGAGTDVAIESAGIVLASDDPRGVTAVMRLSAAGYRKMVQNLWWATAYNVLALPLAAGVLVWAGFELPLAVGALAMSTSTMIVAINAQFLRRIDLHPDGDRARSTVDE